MLRTSVNHSKGVSIKAALAYCLLAPAFSAHAAAPLTPGSPILIPGTHGSFDFIRIDTSANRLLLAHEKNKSFDVFSLDSKQMMKKRADRHRPGCRCGPETWKLLRQRQ